MNNNLVIGDRVEYVDPDYRGFTDRIGKHGRIVAFDDQKYPVVLWDDLPGTRSHGRDFLRKVAPEKPTFNPGDRVRYTGNSEEYNSPNMVGKLGTVLSSRTDSQVRVKWDTPGPFPAGCYPENLEVIPKPHPVTFKDGDRVEFTGGKGSEYQFPDLMGETGTVEAQHKGKVIVRYDRGGRCTHFTENLKLTSKSEPEVAPSLAAQVAALRAEADRAEDQANTLVKLAAIARQMANALEALDNLSLSA